MKILESASKVVFVILALALVLLTFTGKVEAKDFIMLTGMAFTYYFTQAKNKKQDDITIEDIENML